ncbi:MAG: hypothetical protein ACLSHC_00715 [Bilophila wadsworthia]
MQLVGVNSASSAGTTLSGSVRCCAYRRAQGPSHRVVFRPGAADTTYTFVTGIGAEPDDHGVARASVSVLARLVGWFGDRLRVRHRADAG